jgi:hypothetical protein
MDMRLVVDSLMDDMEFVEDDHSQVLVHNHLLNASLDNLDVFVVVVAAAVVVVVVVVELVALQVVAIDVVHVEKVVLEMGGIVMMAID